MQHLIGKKLDYAETYLKQNGLEYIIKYNNHNIKGDTQLVTNVLSKDNAVVLTVSDFIFNLKENNNA